VAANKEQLISRALILSAHSELESTLQTDTSIHRWRDEQGEWMHGWMDAEMSRMGVFTGWM
jgi:hypothetical protein